MTISLERNSISKERSSISREHKSTARERNSISRECNNIYIWISHDPSGAPYCCVSELAWQYLPVNMIFIS